MSEYTPTTEKLLGFWISPSAAPEVRDERRAEFDRWLNSVKAEAWDEGESAGEHNAGNGFASLLSGVESPPPTENPYRTGGAE